ncbi:MAG TPA: D-alanyl-D-alanine carboxypeptidase, partial [Dehalococcoidia bacterium]|nr:D-alanyl-D-alanine carboxypeptidase [Dehalococcoidia bacterium]
VSNGLAGSSDAPPELPWPANGSAAVAVAGVDAIGATKNQKPQPIASLVKVMTAYVVLKDHPLSRGQPGPEVEFTQAHVQNFQARRANVESVVAVTAGGRMTQRDLLRGLMLASANNLADVLAEWNSGSVEAFVGRMNAEAAALGMTNTHYADAAGLDAASVSTANDQLILANAAMANDTFASLVAEVQATLPVAGVVYNTNALLGDDGIAGVKTGWTEDAGACFMFAATWQVEERPVTVIGVVLGQDTLADAFRSARQLIPAAGSSLRLLRVGAAGDPIGSVVSDWGPTAVASLGEAAELVLLPGMQVNTSFELAQETSVKDGSELGTVKLSAGDQVIEVPLKASGSISGPGLLWRLSRLP